MYFTYAESTSRSHDVCDLLQSFQPNTQAIYSQPQVVYLNTNPHAHPQLQAQGGELPPYQPVQAQPQLQPLPVVVLNPNPVCPTRLPAGDKEGQETDSTGWWSLFTGVHTDRP